MAFYIKWKQRGREQDIRETERERECVCVRDGMWQKGRGSIGHKTDSWRNASGEINKGLNCEINKIPENVNDLGPMVSVHFI